jgi:hypothetical protein
MTTRVRRLAVSLTALGFVMAGCGGSSSGGSSTTNSSGGTPLVGTFELTAGSCTTATPTGSYFRMINPNGTVAKGPFFDNPDSACKDKSFSVETPGTDGGLVTGKYQPSPAKAFDAKGNSQADLITKPGTFTAIAFGIETEPQDPQTKTAVPAPAITDTNGKLSGQVTAWAAAWNNQYFNQGSPKPNGASPGLTSPVTGTYNSKTHAFVLTWASQIVGGPFNGFSGYWHLQGHFVAS